MSVLRIRRIVSCAGTGTAGPSPQGRSLVDATIHTYRRPTDAGTDPHDVVRAALPGGAEPSGTIVVAPEGGDGGTVVAFWPDDGAPGGRAHRLVDRLDGVAAGRTPLFAQLTWLNGAGDPDVARAAERGGRERLHPAIRDVDGLVNVLVFRSADDRIVVVALATGRETLTEVQRRIMRTQLLPGEDPALLPGPDRVEIGRLLLAAVPAEVRS